MKIGLFDSGKGGITVLARLVIANPNNDYYYYGDNGNAPYGNKSDEQLKRLADKNVKILLNYKVDVIVVACNTVSTTCEKYLLKKYSGVKFYFIKPQITKKMFKGGCCRVFCTKKTAENLKKTNFKHIKKGRIEIVSCPNLVKIIEKNFLNDANCLNFINLPQKPCKSIYLGCTHYPLILDEFRKKYPLVPIFDGTEHFIRDFLSAQKKFFNFKCKVKPSKKPKIFFLGRYGGENFRVYEFFIKKITKSGKNFTKSG